jgi:hypothetical protein
MAKGNFGERTPTEWEIPREGNHDISWLPCILSHPPGWDAARNVSTKGSHHNKPKPKNGRALHWDGYY